MSNNFELSTTGFQPDRKHSGFQPYRETSGFQPYTKYGGWALSCYEACHDGNFDEKDTSLSARAFRVLQTLDEWKDSFKKFVVFYRAHKMEIEYLCSNNWPKDFVHKDFYETFTRACQKGNLTCLKWLQMTWPNVANSMWHDYAFTTACENGHLPVVLWLESKWRNIIDPHNYNEYPFRIACKHGHLHVAQWLKDKWPAINHRAYTDEAFRYSCINGHLHVAKWLKANWPDINHRAEDDHAFHIACYNGHLSVVLWLKANWPDVGVGSKNSCNYRLEISSRLQNCLL